MAEFRRWGVGESTDEILDYGGEWWLKEGMKATLFTLFTAILMIGCGEPDLNDPKVVEDTTVDAVDESKLWALNGVNYLLNQATPYTGRSELFHENGQKKREANFKDGKIDGLVTEWYENGQKREINFKDGKIDGLVTNWYENGQKRREGNYKDGKMDGIWTHWYENGQQRDELFYLGGYMGSAMVWKPDGEKCSMTDVKAGNGIMVKYTDDGKEWLRITYKEGEMTHWRRP